MSLWWFKCTAIICNVTPSPPSVRHKWFQADCAVIYLTLLKIQFWSVGIANLTLSTPGGEKMRDSGNEIRFTACCAALENNRPHYHVNRCIKKQNDPSWVLNVSREVHTFLGICASRCPKQRDP